MKSDMFRLLLIALVLTGLTAHAQTPQDCPDNAEQVLTNIRLSIGTPNQPSTQDIYNNAKTASNICIGRTHAQSLSADLLAIVATHTKKAADRRFIWGLTHLAIKRSDQAYDSKSDPVVVTMPNGQPHTLYTFGATTELLKSQVMPSLLAEIKNDEVHAIFTTETLDACPYSENADGQVRARTEADALNSWGYYQSLDRISYGVTRLKALKDACSEQAPYLTYALGTYYAKAAHYRSKNGNYPALEWAKKGEALLTEFIGMELKRSDDRTTIGPAKVELKKAQDVLGKTAP